MISWNELAVKKGFCIHSGLSCQRSLAVSNFAPKKHSKKRIVNPHDGAILEFHLVTADE